MTKVRSEYFPVDHRYDHNCFRRLIHIPWATSQPNIMTPISILRKSPYYLGNSCLFGRFWGIFDIWDTQYQNVGNTC